MSKFKALVELLVSTNYIVLTDTHSVGSVSPLYADKFIGKLDQERQRQELAAHRHGNFLDELADRELGEHKIGEDGE